MCAMDKKNDFKTRNIGRLLAAFKKEEVRLFTKHLKVTASPGTRELWGIIKKQFPKFEISDAEIRTAVRPTKPISDAVYRVQLAEMINLAKEFLTLRAFQQNKRLYSNTMADVFMKRRVQKIYEKHRQKNEKILTEKYKLDSEFYHYLHQNKLIDFQYVTVFDPLKTDDSLQQVADFHDYNFLVKKLQYLIVMRNRKFIVETSYNEQGEQEFINYLLTFPLEELPLVNSYYLILCLFKVASLESLQQFTNYFLPIRQQFDINEARQLLTLAENRCSLNIFEGRVEFLQERFTITKIMVEEDHLKVLDHFSNNHFQSTIRNAIEAGQLGWAKWFLINKIPETHPNYRMNLEILGWASYYFAKGEYNKQADYMLKMQFEEYKFTGVYNELVYRILRLKTDFVLLGDAPNRRQKANFQSHLQSYLRYIERKKDIPEFTRKSRENFGLALRLIFNKNYGKRQVEVEFPESILDLKLVAELPWLLQQV